MLHLTSTPPFTSMRFLGFNALSHFNASLYCNAGLTSSVTLFFFNVSLNLTSTLPFTSMLFLGFNALSHFNASLHFDALPRFPCFISLQRFPSLRCFSCVAMIHLTPKLPFSSMLFLGFNASSHFNASLYFNAGLTSSVTLFFF